MDDETVYTPESLWVDPTSECAESGMFFAHPKAPKAGGYLNCDEQYILKSLHDLVVDNMTKTIQAQARIIDDLKNPPVNFVTHSQPSVSEAIYDGKAVDLKESDETLEDGRVIRDGKEYECAIGTGDDDRGCVLSYGEPRDCDYGILPSGRERKSRWTCKYWREMK
jgi:hypothetical protein